MTSKKPLALTNHEIENRAIECVIAHERSVGRTASDARSLPGSKVDVHSVDDATGQIHLIEVKAFGGTGRGDDLWLEPSQVEALEQVPESHLYLVTNVRSEDPSEIRILDLAGEQLRERLEKKREKHYFEVPLPVAVYDDLLANSPGLPTLDGAGFALQVLGGVIALHDRGYHRIRAVVAWAPNGLNVRLHVGREDEMPGEPPQLTGSNLIVSTSLDDAERTAREFAGVMIPAWWSREQIADQLLAALPPVEPGYDDPASALRLRQLVDAHRGAGTVPFTDGSGAGRG